MADGLLEGVEQRTIECAAFEGDRLACFFYVEQVRNANDEDLAVSAFVEALDEESGILGQLGIVISEWLDKSGRPWIEAFEVFTEITELFVPVSHRSRMVWAEAIREWTELAARRVASESGTMLCVLQALPLEISWRISELSQNGWRSNEEVEEAEPREIELGERRQRALVRLYEKQLGFGRVYEEGGWMAKWVG